MRNRCGLLLLGVVLGFFDALPARGEEVVNDSDTMVMLHFNEAVEGTVFTDEAGITEGFSLEPTAGDAVLVDGRPGFGRAFSSGQAVVCRSPLLQQLSLIPLPQFTIEAFLNPDLLPAQRDAYIFSAGPSGEPGALLGIYFRGPSAVHVVRYADGSWRDSEMVLDRPLVIQEWQHFALVFRKDGAWTVTAFLDGKEAGRATLDFAIGSIPEGSCLSIGSCGSSEKSFPGLIDDFRMSSVARY